MTKQTAIKFYFDPNTEGAFEQLQVKNITLAHELGIDFIPKTFLKEIFDTALDFKNGEAFSHFSGFIYKNEHGKAIMDFDYYSALA